MQETLGDDSFTVLSVGFNAPWDSPQAMDEFARRQRIEMNNWMFLSADAATMKNLIRDMGFSYAYSVSGFDHITQLTIIDQQGRIYGQVYGDNFDLPFLAEPLSKLVGREVQPRYSKLESLGNQIRLFCSVYDPKTNTYRVDYLFFLNLFVSLAVIFYMWKLIYREVRRVWPYGKQPPPASSS
jgi:protein SCO1/2